jgi:hypothetical protein
MGAKEVNTLFNCPFCGSTEMELTLRYYNRKNDDHDWYGKITCGSGDYGGGCGATIGIPRHYTGGHKRYVTLINNLLKSWNKRAPRIARGEE